MTHLNENSAVKLLNLFEYYLEDNGVAVFTIHGRYVAGKYLTGKWPYKMSSDFNVGKYAYRDYSHMKDYGISMTPFSWLLSIVSRYHNSIRFCAFIERGWDNHQDVVAITKIPTQS